MSEASIHVCPPVIYLFVPYSWSGSALSIGLGIKFDGRMKCYKLGFGAEELIAIKKVFPYAKIVEGQEYVDQLKEIRNNTLQAVSQGYSNVSLDTVHFKIPPFTHQKEGVKYLDAFNGGALFADCGCLSRSVLVKFHFSRGNSEVLDLETAYKRFSTPHNKKWYVKSFNGELLIKHPIQKIVFNGVKDVYLLELDDGRHTKITANHQLLTKRGWKRLDKLSFDDEIMIDRRWRHGLPPKKYPKKPENKRIAVGKYHPFSRKQFSHKGRSFSYLVEEHRLIYEAHLNGIELNDFIANTYTDKIKNLSYVDTTQFVIHHKDFNHNNNEISNLELLSIPYHKRLHWDILVEKHNLYSLAQFQFSKVKEITPLGEDFVYDIICEDPHRNFIANGIVHHNSGKTAMTLWDIEHKIQVEDLAPSSTLIVGKLMTLHSGWNDDTITFTSLTSKVLWEPSQSEVIKGEVVERISHGEKPAGTGKTFRKTEYRDLRGRTILLAKKSQFDPSKHVAYIREWKQVGDDKYGDETLTPVTRRNVRAENIANAIRSRSEHIHIINHDGLIKFEKELTERNYQMIVIDESTAIKNHKSKTYQALMRIALKSTYRRILSGTPSPQGPQDLWSQFYFLDFGTTFGANYDHFVNKYFNVIELGKNKDTFMGVKLVLRPGSLDLINTRMQGRIFRCKLRDCVDLPPINIGILDVFLDDKQRTHYETMSEAFFSEIDGTRVEVTIDLAKIGKLRQITGGFILSKSGEVIKVSDSNPKLNTLLDFISEIEDTEKIVIFAVFRCEIELLLKTFGDEAVAIYGGETDVGKMEAQKRFKTDPKVRYIICQPQSASYGVNGLTIARYLVFYSIDFRSDCNYQAIKRIERAGQVRSMFVKYLIAKNSIDEIIFKAVYRKDNVQQKTIEVEILETLKRGIDAHHR